MNIWTALVLLTLAVGASANCQCASSKWGSCEGTKPSCQCTLLFEGLVKQIVDCTKMVPKCFLMKAEMFKLSQGQDTRTIGGKPVETAFVDNDGIYNPDCERDGKFKAKQCNGTEECWCVNSAGVRRTDKGDKNLKCEKLVETYWVRLQLKHKEVAKKVDETKLKAAVADAINKRYDKFNKDLVTKVEYDPEGRLIVVDVQKEKGERVTDISKMAYYMEKDVKVLPMFLDQAKFEPMVDGQKLEMEDILVYYVDEEAPTFTMKRLTGGIIAVIVVVVLAVAAGLLVLFFARRREQQRYGKAQSREMEAM